MAKKKKEEVVESAPKKKNTAGKILFSIGLIMLILAALLAHSSDSSAVVALEGRAYQKVKDVKVVGPIARQLFYREPWEMRFTEDVTLNLKRNLFEANDKLDNLMTNVHPAMQEKIHGLESELEKSEARIASLENRVADAEAAARNVAQPVEKKEEKEKKKLSAAINYRTLAAKLNNLNADLIVTILAEYSLEDRAEIMKKMSADKLDEIWTKLEAGEAANLLSMMATEKPAEETN